MAKQIQIRRGLEADAPTLANGEMGWTTDSHKVIVGNGSENFEIGRSGIPTEVATARGVYSSLDARLDSIIASGGNVSGEVQSNATIAASQVVVAVNSGRAADFTDGNRVLYSEDTAGLEYGQITSINTGTDELTISTTSASGQIGIGTIVSQISESEYQAAQAVNHSGFITLPSAMEYVSGLTTYHPVAHGCVGDGATDDRNALNTLVNTTMSAGGIVRIDRSYSVQSALTIPVGVVLRFDYGGKFVIPTGVTITINGAVDAGLYQIFNCAGTGNVAFADGSQLELYPHWWGFVSSTDTADGATNSTALTAALTAAPDYGATVVLIGPFVLDTGIQFPMLNATIVKAITLEGRGNVGGGGWGAAQQGPTIGYFNNAAAGVMIDLTDGNATTTTGSIQFRGAIRNLTLYGYNHASPVTGQIGIKADMISYADFDHVQVMDFDTGILLIGHAYYSRWEFVQCRYNGAYGFCSLSSLNGTRFNNSTFSSNDGYGFFSSVGGVGNTLSSCFIEDNGSSGAYLYDFNHFEIEYTHFESNTTYDIFAYSLAYRNPQLKLIGNHHSTGNRYAIYVSGIDNLVTIGNWFGCYNISNGYVASLATLPKRWTTIGDHWDSRATLGLNTMPMAIVGGDNAPTVGYDWRYPRYSLMNRAGDVLFNDAPDVGEDRLWYCTESGAGTLATDQTVTSATFTVVAATNIFTAASGYTPVDGDLVRVSTTTTLPSPLAANTTYYVISSDGQTFKLEATIGGGEIDITDTGTGTHTVTEQVYGTVQGGEFTVVAATNVFTVDADYTPVDGDMVRFASTTTLPAPLVAATTYYVRDASEQTFKVSTTSSVGTEVDITNTGTGTHTLISNKVTSNSPATTRISMGHTIQIDNAGSPLTYNTAARDYATIVGITIISSLSVYTLDAVPDTAVSSGRITYNDTVFCAIGAVGTNRQKATVANDNVSTMVNTLGSGIVQVVVAGYPSACGIIAFDHTTPSVVILAGGADLEVLATGGNLTGTTGTNGKFTVTFISTSNWNIKVENRLGAPVEVAFSTTEGLS